MPAAWTLALPLPERVYVINYSNENSVLRVIVCEAQRVKSDVQSIEAFKIFNWEYDFEM